MFDNPVLKYSSIALAMLGFVDMVAGALSVLGAFFTEVMEAYKVQGDMLRVLLLVLLGLGVLEFLIAIKGITGCKTTEKGAKCLPWGIVLILEFVAYVSIGLYIGESLSIVALIGNPIVTAAFIAGSVMDVKELRKKADA